MNDLLSSLALLILLGIPIIGGTILELRLAARGIKRRNARLVSAFGSDIDILEGFPIPPEIERVVQGALAHTLNSYRYIVAGNGWLFIQPTHRFLPTFTVSEMRDGVVFSVYAVTLAIESPETLIRHRSRSGFLVSWLAGSVANGTYIWCEGVVDKDQQIYSRPELRLDVLSILSPEVLELVQNPPYNADIYIRKNQLYYIFPSARQAYELVPTLRRHSVKLVPELEANIRRWADTPSNTIKYRPSV